MKRFIFVMAMCAAGVAGPVAASSVLPQQFSFTDGSATTIEVALLSTSAANIELWDGAGSTLVLGITPTLFNGVQAIIGEISYTGPTVTWTPTLAGTATGGGSGTLSSNVFTLGVGSGATATGWSIAGSGVKFDFSLSGGTITNSFTLSDVAAVPVPPAGVMLLSGLAGLFVVARRSRSGLR